MPTSHPLTGGPDPESLLTCPYNASHRLARKRMQFHLTKCRKAYPLSKKQTCPFNATHLVNEQEFLFHLETCSNRGIVDNFTYITQDENHAIQSLPEPDLPDSEENWDNDNCGTYDAAVNVAEAPIIHTLIGATPSERKKFRVQERQRFRALDESISVVKVEPKAAKEKEFPDDQPLRQPTTLPKSLSSQSSAGGDAAGSSGGQSSTALHPEPQPGPSYQDDGFVLYQPKGRGKRRH
ncbi:gametocyte-specific factor 1 homolog [Neodiprion lecontei]|uniref:Gametocyte-specific factor 1 homolog n=1 Tax=Neodiprion lecontei TaxID=441921 RepID=A0A6J0BHY8_NEOLC|nr:gametocyte-specific factor 1 homolog [Neodiprion lecontei]XP_046593102.1 gametocyte-specific factor 1 homolog [Neodiprion lecontei]